MKNAISLFSLILLCFVLQAPGSNAAIEQIEHHQQQVEVSDNPEVCIDCHDSQAGKDHHPIAISCPPQGKEGLFLSADALQSNNIRLFNGKVVCTSCHDLKNVEKSHLVTDNSNSRLCLLCHKI